MERPVDGQLRLWYGIVANVGEVNWRRGVGPRGIRSAPTWPYRLFLRREGAVLRFFFRFVVETRPLAIAANLRRAASCFADGRLVAIRFFISR